MNPILAGVLAFSIVRGGMVVIHFVLTLVVSRDIAESTGKSWLPPDEIDRELQARPLGRFILHTYPVAFWWVLAWDVIKGDNHD